MTIKIINYDSGKIYNFRNKKTIYDKIKEPEEIQDSDMENRIPSSVTSTNANIRKYNINDPYNVSRDVDHFDDDKEKKYIDLFSKPEEEEFAIDSEFPNDDKLEDENDFQGMIRTVHGACLVYKRKNENDSFDELWIYNVGKNLKKETQIRRAIISGTDINPDTQMSDDGVQKAKTLTIGNVQYLNLLNIPQ